MTGLVRYLKAHFQSVGSAFLIIASLTCTALSQKSPRPNLAGTWTMENNSRSLDLTEKDMIIEKTSQNLSAMTLIISDDGGEIKVMRKFSFGNETEEQQLSYHTDGRGETNPGIRSGKRTFHSRTRWEKDRLFIKFDSFSASSSGRPLVALRQVEWRVEDGGKRLVETDTIRYEESKLMDSSVSSGDLRQFSILPPTTTVRRVYQRVS